MQRAKLIKSVAQTLQPWQDAALQRDRSHCTARVTPTSTSPAADAVAPLFTFTQVLARAMERAVQAQFDPGVILKLND